MIDSQESAISKSPPASAPAWSARLLVDADRPNLQTELQVYAEMLVRHLHLACAGIWVAENAVLDLVASAGPNGVLVGPSLLTLIAHSGLPHVSNSISNDPHFHNQAVAAQGHSAFAGYPLLVDDVLEGVMAMFAQKPLPTATLETLTVVSRDIAQSIKRHRADASEKRAPTRCEPVDAAVPTTEVAIITQSPNGVIVDWNPGAEKLFGYARAEVIGHLVTFLIPPDRLDEQTENVVRLARGDEVFQPDTVRLHQSGKLIEVSLTASPLHGRDGALLGSITVVHDLTGPKQREQLYQQAQKMEAFGKLAGGVAHDFNNLLTVVSGYSEILMNRCDPKDPMRDWLTEIHKAGQRAESLTRQLLAFSRKQILEPKVIDLGAVVCDTEKMLRRLIGEDILMTTLFAPNLRPIKVDPGHMQQVVLNLAVNARDAMPKGGRLTIETNNVTIDEFFAESHPPLRAGNYVTLALSDTGVGMSPAVKAQIFEPFFTTKGPGKGTGLGLTTVHSIVQQNGGHIEVESEPGQGTTFRIYLPQVEEPLAAYKSHTHLRTIPRGHETVLFVEDDAAVRTVACHVLETCGYTVLQAADGAEAIGLVQAHEAPIHLLVTDVVMPRLSGPELAERLQALKPDLAVLFLSGYTSDAVQRHGVREDEFAFMQKPFTSYALARKVRDELDKLAAGREMAAAQRRAQRCVGGRFFIALFSGCQSPNASEGRR